ncbi:MAG: EAL domain-containing protein [Lysobacter sp.]|nr:EAL domain-containing protein [Lysobacter sp.]
MPQGYGYGSGTPVDPVTGLFRLGANGPSLTAAIAAAGATGRRIALLHIDVDMFRLINVNMGEDVGDQALAAIAQRLRAAMPAESWLWRLSSDEFLAGIGYLPGELDGAGLAERLHEAFQAPLSLPPYTFPVRLFTGIAIYPDHASDAASLLARADEARRHTKESGLAGIGMYARPVPRERPADADANRIVEALDNGEFRLYYQPRVAASDGSISGFSALLRWHSPTHGVLQPHAFLDTVERVGLTTHLGWWVVGEAARQIASWRERGLEYLDLAIHVPDGLLQQADCVDRIGELLHQHGLDGQRLELEISENALTLDARRVLQSLEGLHKLGITLTIQDFGVSGVGLNALSHYPIDHIKIDRSFIHSVASNPRSAAIVRGIIALGHQLGMKVIAKGVGSEAELAFLRSSQCDLLQGYVLCPPQPVEALDELIRKRFLLQDAFATPQSERTLLLLDDEENVLRSLARLFRRDGYRILTANTVREAFDLLASHRPQVIVSDQRMADMPGTEFLSRVRDLYPDTVRLVLSGYTDLATITEAINRGAIYRFLVKPWNDEELRGHIKDAFADYERNRATRGAEPA